MREVCTGVMFTRVASAVFIKGSVIIHVLCIFNYHSSVRRIERAISSQSCRGNAVKGIHSSFNSIKEIYRLTNSKEMSWFILRKYFIHPSNRSTDVILTKRATDAKSVKIHCADGLRRFFAQVLKLPSLNDPIESLISTKFFVLSE